MTFLPNKVPPLLVAVFLGFPFAAHCADTWGTLILPKNRVVNQGISLFYCGEFPFGAERARALDHLNQEIRKKLQIGRIETSVGVDPVLVLNVHCVQAVFGTAKVGYAIHLELNLFRHALLEHEKRSSTMGVWHSSETLVCPTDLCLMKIETTTKDLMDEFLIGVAEADSQKSVPGTP